MTNRRDFRVRPYLGWCRVSICAAKFHEDLYSRGTDATAKSSIAKTESKRNVVNAADGVYDNQAGEVLHTDTRVHTRGKKRETKWRAKKRWLRLFSLSFSWNKMEKRNRTKGKGRARICRFVLNCRDSHESLCSSVRALVNPQTWFPRGFPRARCFEGASDISVPDVERDSLADFSSIFPAVRMTDGILSDSRGEVHSLSRRRLAIR